MWSKQSLTCLMKSLFFIASTSVILFITSPSGLASTYHTIRAGDNLWSISKHYQVSMNTLLKLNGLTENSILHIGQKIKIKEDQETSDIVFYEVKAGDSLWSIAKKYGVSTSILFRENNLTENSILQIGQKIKISNAKLEGGESVDASKAQPKPTTMKTYVIQKDDSLWTISRAYGITIKSIMAANSLTENSVLQIGMKLNIPTQKNDPPQVLVAQKGESKAPTGFYHTIVSGDTLWNISRKYGVSVSTLMNVNKLKSADRLQINQKLWISSSEKRPSQGNTDQYQIYRVQSGDSLWSIARRYRISMELLMNVNGLNQNSQLRVGQQIRIPTYVSQDYGEASRGYIWPIMGRISSPFGPRGRRIHTGIDITAPGGSIIRAAQSGVVTFSGSMSNYGRTVIITHTDGYQTLYAHNSVNLVTRGQRVNQGDPIAKVGATGNATGNHCHFEVRYNGVAINPMSRLGR